jgi:DNA polymerase III subunit epsilon
MLAFFGDATLIAHNAPFDMQFLNFELEKSRRRTIPNVIKDTVTIARDKHPGARVSLDALCKHYGIDNSKRTLHGALLDSEILAEVYLELIGGRQVAFALVEEIRVTAAGATPIAYSAPRRPVPLPPRLDNEQMVAHLTLIRTMGEAALWGYYRDEEAAWGRPSKRKRRPKAPHPFFRSRLNAVSSPAASARRTRWSRPARPAAGADSADRSR